MKFGVVIGICTDRDDDQRACIESIRAFTAPATPVIAVFNGVAPFALPDGIETRHFPERLGREQGLWRVLFDMATEKGWDWACEIHDDMALEESGWEDDVRASYDRYKIGMASFAAWSLLRPVPIDEGREYTMESGTAPGLAPDNPLAVTIDGCGVAYNMALFGPRGRFSALEVPCGYGETEAGNWALSQGWACARIRKRSKHHWGTSRNARGDLGTPATGQDEAIRPYLDMLPAQVLNDGEIRLGRRTIDVTWAGCARTRPVPLFRPDYGLAEEMAVLAVLRAGQTRSGVEVAAFEEDFKNRLGVPHVVAVGSCTAALHLALAELGLESGDEVIVPPITFVSTVHAVTLAGGTPVFADVDPATLNMDPAAAAEAVTDRTRAIVPVHFGGRPAGMGRLWTVAETRDLHVVEDCAHAAGAALDGAPVGADARSLFACFSFEAVKNLSAGDGGAIVCRDEATARSLKRMRWCGIDKETHARTTASGYSWDYEVAHVGYKYQMTELAAALARVQLRKLDRQNARRAEVAAAYARGLGDLPWIDLPPESAQSSWHIYPIRVPAEARAALMDHLRAAAVQSGVHYKPINLHAAYRGARGETPVAHREWTRLVSLPMHASLTEADVEHVIEAVGSFTP